MGVETEYDLVVYDESCKNAGEEYIKRSEKFEEILETYSTSLRRILDEGIKSGEVHDNLEVFYNAVEGLKDNISTISEGAKGCVDGFIEDIDIADSYLY